MWGVGSWGEWREGILASSLLSLGWGGVKLLASLEPQAPWPSPPQYPLAAWSLRSGWGLQLTRAAAVAFEVNTEKQQMLCWEGWVFIAGRPRDPEPRSWAWGDSSAMGQRETDVVLGFCVPPPAPVVLDQPGLGPENQTPKQPLPALPLPATHPRRLTHANPGPGVARESLRQKPSSHPMARLGWFPPSWHCVG